MLPLFSNRSLIGLLIEFIFPREKASNWCFAAWPEVPPVCRGSSGHTQVSELIACRRVCSQSVSTEERATKRERGKSKLQVAMCVIAKCENESADHLTPLLAISYHTVISETVQERHRHMSQQRPHTDAGKWTGVQHRLQPSENGVLQCITLRDQWARIMYFLCRLTMCFNIDIWG